MNNLDTISTDIVFVVLHYMEKDATMKCVSKIREKIDTPNYKIVIVDNASSNGSGKEIEELYKTAEDVNVIINEENLGFARGNNVGFQFAKENLNPKYIVLLNNDVYIMETYLKEKLDKEYEESQFAVLGPLILTKDGKCDANPMLDGIKNKIDIINRINGIKRVLFTNKYYLFPLYSAVAKWAHNLRKEDSKNKNNNNYMYRQYNVQLHGCFLVFSKKYVDKFSGLDDRTFLYMEEDILYKHMMENELVMVYNPDIVVYHEEDVSTDSIAVSQRKKIDFVYRNQLHSCEVLLEIYSYYENCKNNHRKKEELNI